VFVMDDKAFDQAVVAGAFRLIAESGWRRFSLVETARRAALPIERVRARFPGRHALLLRFGSLADQAALAEMDPDGGVRDRLFGLVMRRIDVLQSHRQGVLALLGSLPADPPTALMLVGANMRSMGWLLEAAGVDAPPTAIGLLRRKGLLAVWLWTVKAWRQDEGEDLSATMAALDTALDRAETAAAWLPGAVRKAAPDAATVEETALPATAAFEPPATDAPAI